MASGLKVVKVMGHTSGVGTEVDKLAIFVEPNTGGQDIDLSQVTVTLTDGTTQAVLNYSKEHFNNSYPYSNIFNVSAYPEAYKFGIIVLQDVDKSLSEDNPVMNTGDKVILAINASYIFGGIEERTKVSGEVRPEHGAPGIIEFTTPPAYTDYVIELQ